MWNLWTRYPNAWIFKCSDSCYYLHPLSLSFKCALIHRIRTHHLSTSLSLIPHWNGKVITWPRTTVLAASPFLPPPKHSVTPPQKFWLSCNVLNLCKSVIKKALHPPLIPHYPDVHMHGALPVSSSDLLFPPQMPKSSNYALWNSHLNQIPCLLSLLWITIWNPKSTIIFLSISMQLKYKYIF